MKKIKEHFSKFCKKNSTNLEEIFKKFTKDTETDKNFLNKEGLENLINFVGLKYDEHQIEDLYDILDQNKDCKILFNEFRQAIEKQ